MSLSWPTDTDDDGSQLVGTVHNNAWLQNIRTELEKTITFLSVTASSAADVNITAAAGGAHGLLVYDATVGGAAFALYQAGAGTPVVLVGQVGPTVFSVSAPAAGEIQIKDSSSRVAIRVGATRNGDTVRVTSFKLN